MAAVSASVVWSDKEPSEAIGVEILTGDGVKVLYSITKRMFAVIYPDADSSDITGVTVEHFKRKFSRAFRLATQRGLEIAREGIYELTASQKEEVALHLLLAEEEDDVQQPS